MNHDMQSIAISKNQSVLHRTLSKLATDGPYYAVLDFPDHSNVGDSAIFLGELEVLRAIHGTDSRYTCSMHSHSWDITRIFPEGPLYLHGGGNFGDLWPAHQKFREHVLRQYPDRKIIQLPQSVHFKDPKALDRCAKAIDKHSDFTLLVRDKESYAIAKEKFNCQVSMCPDAAYALGGLARTQRINLPTLCMLRIDKESKLTPQQLDEIGLYSPIEDWVVDTPRMKLKRDLLIEKKLIKAPYIRKVLQPTLSRVYEKWARARVARGIAQLSKAQFIITDRLHVHILSTLLNIPHIVYDNNYGKLSRYIKAWPKDKKTKLVYNIEDLLATINEKK